MHTCMNYYPVHVCVCVCMCTHDIEPCIYHIKKKKKATHRMLKDYGNSAVTIQIMRDCMCVLTMTASLYLQDCPSSTSCLRWQGLLSFCWWCRYFSVTRSLDYHYSQIFTSPHLTSSYLRGGMCAIQHITTPCNQSNPHTNYSTYLLFHIYSTTNLFFFESFAFCMTLWLINTNLLITCGYSFHWAYCTA